MDSSNFTGLYLQVSFAIFEFRVYCRPIISLILDGQVFNFGDPVAAFLFFNYLKDYWLNFSRLVDITAPTNLQTPLNTMLFLGLWNETLTGYGVHGLKIQK